jgi:Peroxisomal membrane protein (Pex16)
MNIYERWYRRNAAWVNSIEDSLRTLTLFLPGRFAENEVQSEV